MALVIPCRKWLKMLGKPFFNIFATSVIGERRQRAAQPYQLLKNFLALPAELFFDRPCSRGFQLGVFERPEVEPAFLLHVLRVEEPGMLRTSEAFVAFLLQGLVLLPTDLVDCVVEMFADVDSVVDDFSLRCMRSWPPFRSPPTCRWPRP